MGITGDECEEILRARGKEVTRPPIEEPEKVLPPKKEREVKKSGTDSVDDIIKRVENGDIPLSNNIQKGNYGEMKMDVYFKSQVR